MLLSSDRWAVLSRPGREGDGDRRRRHGSAPPLPPKHRRPPHAAGLDRGSLLPPRSSTLPPHPWMLRLPVCASHRALQSGRAAPGLLQRLAPVLAAPRRSVVAQRRRMSVQATGMDQFDSKLAGLPSAGAFVLFKADWCPDCRRSTQAVRDAVTAVGGQLLEVEVSAQPPAWKTPAHPLRKDPRFQLSGIPTLVFWKDGAAAAKLGAKLERAPTTAAAAQVAAEFVKRNSS